MSKNFYVRQSDSEARNQFADLYLLCERIPTVSSLNKGLVDHCGEYRSRTDDLLRARQAL